ncbi:MAG: tRNA uridine-5-carboxymethylaminomethyl(34) synthesis GTPase MnmE [Clostridia bacterium]|nr:tRNA uridine-5-carboxymethylaminomethyl(34) synthesis GTPase MnmE [Clostridia bacterium]
MTKNTIVAIATPIGSGGISIIRLSGESALKIADQMFLAPNDKKISELDPRVLNFGTVSTAKFKDICLCVYFKAPNSYTGEDVIEFQSHGGIKIAEGILNECMLKGARLAEAGEFTKRAFLNGKTSLENAEGVVDMINAESEAELRAGYSLISGKLNEKVKSIQKILTDTTAQVEVEIDYPEYDIKKATITELSDKLTNAIAQIEELVSTSQTGQIIKNGINVVIIGSPNVGKSSLLNALLNSERAIVTEIAGTTRDTLQESYVFKGVKVNIVDTAGIRNSQDSIEIIGIERAKQALKQADLALLVFDCSKPLEENDYNNIKLLKNHRKIVVINKNDIFIQNTETIIRELEINETIIKISALKKSGIELLKKAIYDAIIDNNVISSRLIITNMRHINALNASKDALTMAKQALNTNSMDCVADDLRTAWQQLGEITGEVYTDEILNAIFSKFCLGK